jgi:hypothetical protein
MKDQPAFPHSFEYRGERGQVEIRDGLTKREWFAGMVLARVHWQVNDTAAANVPPISPPPAVMANAAVQIADALIAELEKPSAEDDWRQAVYDQGQKDVLLYLKNIIEIHGSGADLHESSEAGRAVGEYLEQQFKEKGVK